MKFPLLAQVDLTQADRVEAAKKAVADADANLAAVSAGGAGESAQVVWTSGMVTTLTLAILVFTLVVLGLMTVLLKQNKENNHVGLLKSFGIIVIISMSSILLVVGYSNEQLTPIVGLFGAIAGYLLGKESGARANEGGNAER